MINDVVETRIERCQAGLPQAVHASDGAHFRMLLSLINSNQAYEYAQTGTKASGEGFELPDGAARLKYPEADQLYTSEVVQRLNASFNQGARGDFAYACSWVDTQAHTPEGGSAPGDSLERLALQLNGKLMLAEVGKARSALNTRA